MKTLHDALVVLDPSQPATALINRARMIAHAKQTHLHLLVCDNHKDHGQYLTDMRNHLTREGYRVSAEQSWQGSPHHSIIAQQQTRRCGLVLKQHRADGPLRKALRLPDDWKLMSHCPCPVLMVKGNLPWAGGNILVSVDAGNDDLSHRVLQVGVVSHGHEIARMVGARLHMMSAHPSPMLSSHDPLFQRSETIRDYYREQCRGYQDEFAIDDKHLHLEEGPAEVMIPYVARNLGAALTVIGSVGRSGLQGALVGNTVETVLDQLDCDVLVLKPHGVLHDLEELAAHEEQHQSGCPRVA